jgi:predicted metal-dependent hydrolase
MKKLIAINNENISYTFRKSKRARRMRLAVYCDGSVVVTAPAWMGETMVQRFICEKAQWLYGKIMFFKQHKTQTLGRGTRAEYLKYKEITRQLVKERLEYFNGFYGFRFNALNIKNQKTRWGSCSRKGNLNFNYKLALLPAHVADYIIVHELCHLSEFNHSRKFWELVARTVPEHKKIRKELNKGDHNPPYPPLPFRPRRISLGLKGRGKILSFNNDAFLPPLRIRGGRRGYVKMVNL